MASGNKNKPPRKVKVKKPKKYKSSQETSTIWKVLKSRGFKSEKDIERYQIVKKDHKILSGNDLPKLKEVITKWK